MSGWADDYESSLHLANAEACKLHEKDPKHELLRFWFLPSEDLLPGGKPDLEKEKANQIAMKNRFWDRPTPWQSEAGMIVCTIVMTNYYLALKRVNDGEPEVVEQPPAPPPPVPWDKIEVPF